ncbi:MAG: hypothetical protein AAGC44_01625 [Planctomycetota bacterium]
MPPNNPAGRLLQLLNKIDVKRVAADSAANVWGRMLDLDPLDAEFLPRLSKALRLPWEIEHEVRAIEEINHDMYLTWVHPFQQATTQLNLNGQFSPFASVLDHNALSLIAICDDQLSRTRPEPSVDEHLKASLEEQVAKLRSDIDSDSEFIGPIRDYVLYHVSLIEQALNDFKVQGVYAFKAAAERAIGYTYMNKDTVQNAGKSKHGEACKLAIATLVFAAISAYPHIKEIGADVTDLLGLPQGVEETEGGTEKQQFVSGESSL